MNHNLKAQILNLPIYKNKEELINLLKSPELNVIIIMGETGSGKTTQVPKIIYENFPLNNNRMICITQPRRIAAISISERVAEELDSKIGDIVGYSVRFKEKMSKKTKIKFVTDGMLVRECILDKNLEKYNYIILDEIHERSIHTDILMMICKDLLMNKRKHDLKLIIMSATLDPKKYMEYFYTKALIKVQGRKFPIKVYNISEEKEENNNLSKNNLIKDKESDYYDLISKYIDRCLNCILQIVLSEKEEDKTGDILVFLPGQEDIEDLQELLKSKKEEINNELPNNNIEFKVLPLYGSLPSNQQLKIFRPLKNKKGKTIRKIILATNIAETSLTIKNIKYIIDSGFFKMRKFYPKLNIDTLKVTQISKNSALQRTGRAGRESAGICYRLYTQAEYKNFNEQTEPEILRINLRNISLQLFSIGYSNFNEINFIDKPPMDNFSNAFDDLISYGALDKENKIITSLGKKMAILPMDPIYSLILINSLDNKYHDVFDDIVSIISVLQSDNIYYNPNNLREKIEKIREKYLDPISDHLSLKNIFNEYKKSNNKEKFCKENFLNDKALAKSMEIYKQIKSYLEKIFMDEFNKKEINNQIQEKIEEIDKYLDKIKNKENNEDKNELIIDCLLRGYFNNIAKYSNDNFFETLKGNQLCKIHPTSVLIRKPKLGKQYGYLIFNEMIITSKKYIKCCTLITPQQADKYISKNKKFI
jgi:HrpA-like RNA helicase